VHYQNKWRRRGGNLGDELHEEIRERRSPELRIAGGGYGWEREQRKKKEEEGLRPNWYRDKGTSLINALLCYKGAIPTDATCFLNLAGSIGHHHP
jgi:hypothetical protein